VPENVVLLHGFGGTRRAFDAVSARLSSIRYRPLALDLPGHGSERSVGLPITFASCVEHVLARSPDRFTLCGYSMGGRVALHVALTAPERVARLTLIACSPGIEDIAERRARADADEHLASQLEDGPYERFIERWRTQPLFADEPPAVGALAREDQRRNDPTALAAVLRGIGTGQMQPLWSRLGELEMPVVVLVGDRDRKFVALGERIVKLLADGELIVVPGGHGLPFENPAAVAGALEASLRHAAHHRPASDAPHR
jgi:2-succinyl-6-hydroxy-2,4-cyclohexadiene-1-carboxylate synthase